MLTHCGGDALKTLGLNRPDADILSALFLLDAFLLLNP
jgi:hypothetical protein